jgi:hypothetical protein
MALDTEFRTMKCERCRKSIEANEIRFAIEGDWMGKPLCRRCKAQTENESRDSYRKGRVKECSRRHLYETEVYKDQNKTTEKKDNMNYEIAGSLLYDCEWVFPFDPFSGTKEME